MKIRPCHLPFTLLGAVFALASLAPASVEAQTINWNTATYTAGALNQNIAVGGNSAAFAFSGNTAQFGAVVTGVNTPAIGNYAANNNYADGGTGFNALQLYMDFSANTQAVTLLVTLATPVPVVSFSLFDVDRGTAATLSTTYTFIDQASAISATSNTGATLLPTLTAGANTTISGNSAYGSNTSNNNTATSNLGITFSNPLAAGGIKSFQFTYGNHVDGTLLADTTQADPAAQIIAIGNIQIPEPGTVVGVLGGCVALGASAFRRRRGLV